MKLYQTLAFVGGLATAIAGYDKAYASKPEAIPKPASRLETRLTEADRRTQEFPTEIPGARKVLKFEVPGSKYCLVHVRQIHPVPGLGYFTDKQTNQVHKEIYSILSQLIAKVSLPEVYVEGVVKDEEKIVLHADGVQKSIYSSFKGVSDSINSKLYCFPWNLVMSKPREFEVFDSGELRLAKEKRLKIRGAEKEKTYRLACEELKKSTEEGREENRKIILEDREDALLELITAPINPVAVTIYGGAHGWRDNINRWNSAHPDKKFSLIVITPKSYVIPKIK